MPHSHIPIMFNFIFHVCANFHVVNIDVPASVGAPPLNIQHLDNFLLLLFVSLPTKGGQKSTWKNSTSLFLS